jgi:hypothetical protein
MSYLKSGLLLAVSALVAMSFLSAEEVVNGRRSVVLQGSEARLVLDIMGGSIASFELKDQGLSPLNFGNRNAPADRISSMSHFLCLDRWGPPTEAERANGMRQHGEKVEWQIEEENGSSARMSAVLPIAGLRVERSIEVAAEGNWFHVSETVTNQNPLGRVYNMVQHATIGPPFLDESVVVDSNATKGFAQGGSLPTPEEPSTLWPMAPRADGPVDMRHLSDDPNPDVVSYVIDDNIGWVTAANAAKGLLIGYFWETEEYPWLNLWRSSRDGKPMARGLEFGSTGLHQPFPALVKKGFIFGRPLVQFIDTGEGQTRSYVGFLAEIPENYQGVDDLVYENGELTLIERGGGSQIRLSMPSTIAR